MALTQITEKGIKDGEILNADINASAAIAGTKISPDFGSQNIVTTGSITGADLEIDSGTLSVDASDNRVGIGTTSPLAPLHIYNATNNTIARLESGDATSRLQLKDNSGEAFVVATGDNLIFSNTSSITERMRIDSSGNVGIGTTSPNAKFVISDSSTFTAYGGSVPSIGDCMQSLSNVPASEAINNHATFQFGVNGGSHNRVNSISAVAESASNRKLAFAFCTDSGSNRNERMRISADGNVGIGTTSPDKPIHIFRASNDAEIRLQTNSGTERNSYISLRESSGDLDFYTVTASNMKFHTSNTERMRIDSAGNVSIGSTSNVAPLNVRGMTDGNLHVRPITSIHSGTGVGLDVLNDANNAVKDLAIRAATIVFRNASAEIARTNANGLVVGSISFDSNNSIGVRLFAHGTVHSTRDSEYAYVGRRSNSNGGMFLFRRDSTDVGNISVTTSATSYNSGSDYRLKQDDTPLIDGLTRLKQLKPIKFKWKNDTSQFVDGFFAHEVSSIVPNAITGEKDAVYEKDDELGHKKGDPIYQQIDHGKLVPLLVAALQEEIVKREELEARVAALEAA
jgi:hypothetical protein